MTLEVRGPHTASSTRCACLQAWRERRELDERSRVDDTCPTSRGARRLRAGSRYVMPRQPSAKACQASKKAGCEKHLEACHAKQAFRPGTRTLFRLLARVCALKSEALHNELV